MKKIKFGLILLAGILGLAGVVRVAHAYYVTSQIVFVSERVDHHAGMGGPCEDEVYTQETVVSGTLHEYYCVRFSISGYLTTPSFSEHWCSQNLPKDTLLSVYHFHDFTHTCSIPPNYRRYVFVYPHLHGSCQTEDIDAANDDDISHP